MYAKCLYLATIVITKDIKFNSLKFSNPIYTSEKFYYAHTADGMDNSTSIPLANFSLTCTCINLINNCHRVSLL